MSAYTISLSRGRVSEHHTKRDYVPKNARDYLKNENKTLVTTKSYKEGFNEFFKDSIEEFNAKQKRKSNMKSEDYYDYILHHSDNGEVPIYSYVLQIGNRDTNSVTDHSDENMKLRGILDRVAEQLPGRYPNFKFWFIGSHGDETNGTYHYTLDFTPWHEGYKTGMKRRCSLNKALADMGLQSRGAMMDKFKADLEQLVQKEMEKEGFERDYKNEHRQRIDTYDYVREMDLKSREDWIDEQVTEIQHTKKAQDDREKAQNDREESLDKKQDDINQQEKTIADQYQDMIAREQALAMKEESLDIREQSIEQKEKEQEEKEKEFQKREDALEAQEKAQNDKETLLNERSRKINETRKKQMEQGNLIKDTCRLAQQERKWLDEKDKQHAEAIQQRLNIDIVDYSAENDYFLSK